MPDVVARRLDELGQLLVVDVDTLGVGNLLDSASDVVLVGSLELDVKGVICNRLDFFALSIVADAYDRGFSLLYDLKERLEASSVTAANAITLIHDDHAFFVQLASVGLLEWISLSNLLLLLSSYSPVVDASVSCSERHG